jgi:hypothetical protein
MNPVFTTPEPLQEGGQARVYLCAYQDNPIVLKVYKSASGSALERELSAVSQALHRPVLKRRNFELLCRVCD